MEKKQERAMKEMVTKLERRIEEAFGDIAGLTEKQVDFRLNFEEKLDGNLESIWNVVADLRAEVG